MKRLNSLIFVVLLLQRPNFMITVLHVGALITKVKNAKPAILKIEINLNFYGRKSFAARIKVNAMPTAPLKPPYVNAKTSFQCNP